MKPLIKWPGGKSREIVKLAHLVPQTINRYIEPFFGGGAVYFHVSAKNSLVNDIDANLIQFYNYVKNQDEQFLQELNKIGRDWNDLKSYSETLNNRMIELIFTYRSNHTTQDELRKRVSSNVEDFKLLFDSDEQYTSFLIGSLSSKIHRVVKLEEKHNMKFDEQKLSEHIETAVRAAYYTMLRDTEEDLRTRKIAKFYFIREFCYGSMFRYNQAGKFNIPYGGINYNNKSFESKVQKLTSEKVQNLLKTTKFHNTDFSKFLNEVNPQADDFVFFDPPYDTDFKEYGNTPFGLSDHKRLADVFGILPSKNIMIINSNENILKLYEKLKEKNPNITIKNYEKTYTYNVRGRNKRETNHLLITNFI